MTSNHLFISKSVVFCHEKTPQLWSQLLEPANYRSHENMYAWFFFDTHAIHIYPNEARTILAGPQSPIGILYERAAMAPICFKSVGSLLRFEPFVVSSLTVSPTLTTAPNHKTNNYSTKTHLESEFKLPSFR